MVLTLGWDEGPDWPAMHDLMSIGRFARLSGLTIDALRHYDELGILRPAEVDRQTGYRRYRPAQLEEARRIGWLRSVDMPLSAIGAWVAADPAGRAVIQRAQLAAVDARITRLQRIAHRLRVTIEAPEGSMTTAIVLGLEPEARRQLAIDLFNQVWTLLEMPQRTIDQDDEMLHAAHASRYHWGEVGDAANRARGEWQCSRVYAVLERSEPALHHARRCLAICRANDIAGWDIAAAWEASARAALVAGDRSLAERSVREARAALVGVDEEDRTLIGADLDELELRLRGS